MKGSALANGADTRATERTVRGREFEGLTRDDLLDAYRMMLLSRRIDDKEIQLKNQSQIFFQISGAGHEAVLVAAGTTARARLRLVLPLLPRPRAVPHARHDAARDAARAVGSKDDPANGGRQMPSHWGHRALNIPSQSSPTGTQCLQAVGCAEAGAHLRAASTDIPDRESNASTATKSPTSRSATARPAKASSGSRSTPPARDSCPSLYLVEDNGYAIRCRSKCRRRAATSRGSSSASPDLPCSRCDGTDFLASYARMREAVDVRARAQGPALVHAKVIRPYSHSLSDDEKLYKTPEEREAEARARSARAHAPVALARGPRHRGRARRASLATVEREVNDAADAALRAPKPEPETAALYVYSPDVDPTSAAFAAGAGTEGKPDTMVAAINRTLKDEMARNPRIVVFGEDVADASREDGARRRCPARAACSR